jgi:hypothetical protein
MARDDLGARGKLIAAVALAVLFGACSDSAQPDQHGSLDSGASPAAIDAAPASQAQDADIKVDAGEGSEHPAVEAVDAGRAPGSTDGNTTSDPGMDGKSASDDDAPDTSTVIGGQDAGGMGTGGATGLGGVTSSGGTGTGGVTGLGGVASSGGTGTGGAAGLGGVASSGGTGGVTSSGGATNAGGTTGTGGTTSSGGTTIPANAGTGGMTNTGGTTSAGGAETGGSLATGGTLGGDGGATGGAVSGSGGAAGADASTADDAPSSDTILACTGCLIDGTCYADGQDNPANACQACAAGASAWTDKTDATSCAAGVCHRGACVACIVASDCPAQDTACVVNTCDSSTHTCGTAAAAPGTACTDNGGAVCNRKGACTAQHCNDGVLNGDESWIDVGGSCGTIISIAVGKASGTGQVLYVLEATSASGSARLHALNVDGTRLAAPVTLQAAAPTLLAYDSTSNQVLVGDPTNGEVYSYASDLSGLLRSLNMPAKNALGMSSGLVGGQDVTLLTYATFPFLRGMNATTGATVSLSGFSGLSTPTQLIIGADMASGSPSLVYVADGTLVKAFSSVDGALAHQFSSAAAATSLAVRDVGRLALFADTGSTRYSFDSEGTLASVTINGFSTAIPPGGVAVGDCGDIREGCLYLVNPDTNSVDRQEQWDQWLAVGGTFTTSSWTLPRSLTLASGYNLVVDGDLTIVAGNSLSLAGGSLQVAGALNLDSGALVNAVESTLSFPVTVSGNASISSSKDLTLSNSIGGTGQLAVAGSAAVRLTAANPFSGTLVVGSGGSATTLQLDGSVVGDLSVSSGASLAGAGSIGGKLTNSGQVHPSTPALTAGSFEQTSGGVLFEDVCDGCGYLAVTNAATLAGTLWINSVSSSGAGSPYYVLVQASGPFSAGFDNYALSSSIPSGLCFTVRQITDSLKSYLIVQVSTLTNAMDPSTITVADL